MKSMPFTKKQGGEIELLYRYAYLPTQIENIDGTYQWIWFEYYWEIRIWYIGCYTGMTRYISNKYSYRPLINGE